MFSALMKVRVKLKVANMIVSFPGTSPGPLTAHTPLPSILSQGVWLVLSERTKTLTRVKIQGWSYQPLYLSGSPVSLFFFLPS